MTRIACSTQLFTAACFFLCSVVALACDPPEPSDHETEAALSKAAEDRLAAARQAVDNIDTAQLAELLKTQPNTVLLDVRGREEVMLTGAGTIDAPYHVSLLRGWLELKVHTQIPKLDTPIVVYCGLNERSPLAAQTLTAMGYSNVKNYADGFFEWEKAGMPIDVLDKAQDSFLYSKPIKVTDGVWSAIGATAPYLYENSGHNNNLSFIITDEGVVVINAGTNYLIAASLHDEIRKITDKPVKYVVLENEQGHAVLGTNYWKEQGVPVIAHERADAIVRKHGQRTLDRMRGYARERAWKTELAYADKTFSDTMVLELGGQRIELLYFGPAHGPADIAVWLPQKEVLIAGDLAFHERLLPIFEDTDTANWLEIWDKMLALNPKHIIPGHGGPATEAQITRATKDYLVYMREQVAALLDDGGGLVDVYKIDQSQFAYLDAFQELSALNASTLFRLMEFE